MTGTFGGTEALGPTEFIVEVAERKTRLLA